MVELIIGSVICLVLYHVFNIFIAKPMDEADELNAKLAAGDEGGTQWHQLTDYQKKIWRTSPHGTPLWSDDTYPDMKKKEFYKYHGFRLSDMSEKEAYKVFGHSKKELYKMFEGPGCIYL